ncbi:MAG TPA: phage holin family protein [Chlorobaculum parvum]|uniref:Phage holin family protein n=1 Tax=Chlorobaculum parvum TaxID=274539 RepID=A0A7C5HAZ4_9CHLB|nr:phage holin family protein [Chlorobaculum parvum]
MFRILIHWLVSATAVYVTANMLSGIAIRSFGAAMIVAVVLGLINVFIKPLLVVLTIPTVVLTLGLFMLVINALMLMLAAWFVDGFAVSSFWWAVLGSLCISLVSWLMSSVLNI